VIGQDPPGSLSYNIMEKHVALHDYFQGMLDEPTMVN